MIALVTCLFALVAQSLALAEPLATAAAQLEPRQGSDPAFVGWIYTNTVFSDSRSCDYPATVTTSGSYQRCCDATNPCPFFTTCSSNTLIAGTETVPCDFDDTLTCNTAIVEPAPGTTTNAHSYLACWQRTLGNGPFTIVQNIGTYSVAQPSTTPASGSTSTGSSTGGSGSPTRTTSPTTRAGSTTTTTTTSSPNAAPTGDHAGINGAVLGGLAVAAQLLL